jgi:hypothetical protein
MNDYEGKRFSRHKNPYIDVEKLKATGKKRIVLNESFEEMLTRYISGSTQIMRDIPKDDKRDSHYQLAKRLKRYCEVVLNESLPLENRFHYAVEVGITYQLIKTYYIESTINKRNAKGKEREWPELGEWAIDLINEGKTYSQIWDLIPSSNQSDESDYQFYKDDDKLFLKIDGGKTRRPISRNHFIKKTLPKIKKTY